MMNQKLLAGMLGVALCVPAFAHERLFTYTYEPETMPEGLFEFEQSITLRTQRNKAVGEENFNRWELRESLEYGVTDNYTVEGYLNFSQTSFRDPATGTDSSSFHFDGISIENRYLLVNPVDHPFGVSLYLEPTFSGDEAEVEQKIIIGQRHGSWKWAFNLTHATEWENNLHDVEGELEESFGLAYNINKHWAVGAEFRNHNELPDYNEWENTAFYLGPVISYHSEKFWGALTVMPQIYGANFSGDPDLNHHLELEGHERVNVRLMFGVTF